MFSCCKHVHPSNLLFLNNMHFKKKNSSAKVTLYAFGINVHCTETSNGNTLWFYQPIACIVCHSDMLFVNKSRRIDTFIAFMQRMMVLVLQYISYTHCLYVYENCGFKNKLYI